METLAEQPVSKEKQKSFDPCASVNMFRYDLEEFGQVLPETRERVADEELSFLAEAVDRAARTTFALKRESEDLVYFDKGEWRPYMATLVTGLQVAEREATVDYRKAFLAGKASEDLRHGYALQALQPGERYSWHSSYAHDEAARYGDGFMDSCGLVSKRKMGFLYTAVCQPDGSVILESQTVDQSDPEAFAAVAEAVANDPELDLDCQTALYDSVLMKRNGGYFFAGRRDAEAQENAWRKIEQQHDLVEYHLNELERIARTIPSATQEESIKHHTYGVWALFKKRLDNDSKPVHMAYHVVRPLRVEVEQAYHEFAKRGEVLVGCGGAIDALQANANILAADPSDISSAIFGKERKERYSFNKKMYCVECQAPPEEGEGKKMCGPCGLCRGCDKKYGGDG